MMVGDRWNANEYRSLSLFTQEVLARVLVRYNEGSKLVRWREKLNKAINDEGRIYIIPAEVDGLYFLRFAICSRFTESSDVNLAFNVIVKNAEIVLQQEDE